jgi:hypothetical protein
MLETLIENSLPKCNNVNSETISRQDYTSKIKINKELFYLLGVYLSDGSIGKKNFQLQVIDKDFAEFTLECWKKLIPTTKAYLRERNDNNLWNKKTRYIIKLGIGEYANYFRDITNNKHHIPFCVWKENDGLKRWFIAGIMDGDGWISKTIRPSPPFRQNKFQYRIGVGGVADGWIYEFRQLLNEMKVKCNKIERFQTKNGNWFCKFNVKPITFFKANLFFTIKRKRERCIIASETSR